MNRINQWLFRRIVAREVLQGFDHGNKITNLYREIRIAVTREFNEDNAPTLGFFLDDCYASAKHGEQPK